MRGWSIDNTRQQVLVSEKNREIADVGLRQTLASTTRTVRNAYWDLAYAVASLAVQQQSLDLAQESLRNTRVTRRDRHHAADRHRRSGIRSRDARGGGHRRARRRSRQPKTRCARSSSIRRCPTSGRFTSSRPTCRRFKPVTVDIDAAVRNALERRTDLQQTKSLEANDINIRYLRNQTLPDVQRQCRLRPVGARRHCSLHGRIRSVAHGDVDRADADAATRRVLGDLLRQRLPDVDGVAEHHVSDRHSPGGRQPGPRAAAAQPGEDAAQEPAAAGGDTGARGRAAGADQPAARARRRARRAQLAERRLEAEQRKFAAGTSTSFLVFQAQRDLAQARNNELRAILDYSQSVVDLETVQEVPLSGGGGGVDGDDRRAVAA